MTCPQAYSDGAYVLGALGPAERCAYEAHLAECEACASAVAQLTVLPGLLGRIGEEELAPVPPSPTRLTKLIEQAAQVRRRQAVAWRWRFAVALVAVTVLAIAGTAATLGAVIGQAERGPSLVAMVPVAADSTVVAEVGYEPVTGGTKVRMVCRYPAAARQGPGRIYRLVATGVDGTEEYLGSWRAQPGEEVDLTGLTQFPAGELTMLELRNADGDPVLVYRVSR